jgi:hypothetical protein
MNADIAKTELLTSHFRHALDQLCGHSAEVGDMDGLADVRRMVEAAVDDALVRIKPRGRLSQQVEIDDETGRMVLR